MPPRDMIYAPDGRTWFATALSGAAERGKLQEALKPFAADADRWDPIPGAIIQDDVEVWQQTARTKVTVGDLRRARAALNESTANGAGDDRG